MCILLVMQKLLVRSASDCQSSRRATKLAAIEWRERLLDMYVITCTAVLTAAMALMVLVG